MDAELERLKRAAELQMCRRGALEEHDESGSKRLKTGDAEGEFEKSRFAYAASEDLARGRQGFLITCMFRREKSASKEAAELLQHYLTLPAVAASAQAPAVAAAGGSAAPEAQPAAAAGSGAEPATVSATVAGQAQGSCPPLSIAKVSACGVVVLLLPPQETSSNTADGSSGSCSGPAAAAAAAESPLQVVRRLAGDVLQGRRPHLKFCQRMYPLQSSCAFTEEALQACARQVAAAYCRELLGSAAAVATATNVDATSACASQATVDSSGTGAANSSANAGEPVRFAVVFKNRGPEVAAAGVAAAAKPGSQPASNEATADGMRDHQSSGKPRGGAEASAEGEGPAGAVTAAVASAATAAATAAPDRNVVVKVLAGAMLSAFEGGPLAAVVDLSKPQVLFMCEVIPMGQQLLCGLSIIDGDTFVTKPRMQMKLLTKS